MKLRVAIAIGMGLWLCAGCGAPVYQAPKDNEPAAIIKLKFDYDRSGAAQAIPGGGLRPQTIASVSLGIKQEGNKEEKDFAAYSRGYSITKESGNAPNLEVDSVRVRPGEPVTVKVWLGVSWQTQAMETVTSYRTVYRQEMRTTSEYNYSTKSTQMVTRMVNVTVQEPYTETKMVTHTHARGCQAFAPLTPQKDAAYLVDFTAPTLESGCSMKLYRQVAGEGGSFKLEPVSP